MVPEPQERRLVPVSFQAVKILIVSLLEDLIPVRLVVHYFLLFEALGPSLLLVEDLEDLGLVHKNVREVHLALLITLNLI